MTTENSSVLWEGVKNDQLMMLNTIESLLLQEVKTFVFQHLVGLSRSRIIKYSLNEML